ncbi:MAG: hypothetical protein OXG36_06575 [Caldilineaceae bacterium]|nr:hypothetical protein [Caldilineaceae bacterium]
MIIQTIRHVATVMPEANSRRTPLQDTLVVLHEPKHAYLRVLLTNTPPGRTLLSMPGWDWIEQGSREPQARRLAMAVQVSYQPGTCKAALWTPRHLSL